MLKTVLIVPKLNPNTPKSTEKTVFISYVLDTVFELSIPVTVAHKKCATGALREKCVNLNIKSLILKDFWWRYRDLNPGHADYDGMRHNLNT